MKQAYQITLLLLAILPALRQDPQPASVCHFKTKYDRAADTTTIQCNDLVGWGEAADGLTVHAQVSFPGKEPNGAAKFCFFLTSNKGGATRHTQPLFQEAKMLYLTMDTVRLEIPVADYRYDFYELIHACAESARAEIGREDLRKLLEAKSLAGKWGNVEFKFSETAFASLKDFISRQIFAAHT